MKKEMDIDDCEESVQLQVTIKKSECNSISQV